MSRCAAALVVLLLTGAVAPVRAQTYPDHPVKVIVPIGPAGSYDILGRLVADQLTRRLNQSFVVENRPGAGTIVATAAVAKAPPDGHTVLIGTNSLLINPAIEQKLPYDTFKELAGISMVATQPVALVANRSFPASSIPELVAEAKKRADPLNYASPGPRGVGHLAGEMLKIRAGIAMTHVNYNGSAPALTDVIAGRVPLMFDVWHSAKRYVDSGELKLIAGAGRERLADAPDVPTIAETFSGFDVIAFNAMIAPAGVPNPILLMLADAVRAVVGSPEFAARTRNLGIFPQANTPEELDRWMLKETARWAEIAKAANVKAE